MMNMNASKEELIATVKDWYEWTDDEGKLKDGAKELLDRIIFLINLGFDICELLKPKN